MCLRTLCMHFCMCMFLSAWVCDYVCVTWTHNSALDSFIKCGATNDAAVNQFYLPCVGGQLSWQHWTLTPQEWTGWILLLQLCCCKLVVKGDLFQREKNGRLLLYFVWFQRCKIPLVNTVQNDAGIRRHLNSWAYRIRNGVRGLILSTNSSYMSVSQL